MRQFVACVGLTAALLLAGCGGDDDTTGKGSPAGPGPSAPGVPFPSAATPGGRSQAPITVTSSAFADGGQIPRRHTCRGQNQSPPLAWTGVPAGAAALALVVDDPDAVGGLYIHWVVSDIPATAAGSAQGAAPQGGRVGANSGGDRSYLGPCPPAGTGLHHYRFTLYALSKRSGLAGSTPARQAVEIITKAAVAQGRLVGTFSG